MSDKKQLDTLRDMQTVDEELVELEDLLTHMMKYVNESDYPTHFSELKKARGSLLDGLVEIASKFKAFTKEDVLSAKNLNRKYTD